MSSPRQIQFVTDRDSKKEVTLRECPAEYFVFGFKKAKTSASMAPIERVSNLFLGFETLVYFQFLVVLFAAAIQTWI